ncbi:MAG: hypothetical protein LBQ61_03025 [Spirochaetales bacterium]|jgi:uncharacterized integral membrane protein|nr:hypothetical protein [Spirochaetales bacterium]
MAGRFFFFIFCLVILLIFAGFNFKNVSDISLGFHTFKEVPIFLSLLCSFTLGVVFSLPFIVSHRLRSKTRADKKDGPPPESPVKEKPAAPPKAPKEGLFGRKKPKKNAGEKTQAGKFDDYRGSEDDLPNL